MMMMIVKESQHGNLINSGWTDKATGESPYM
jgi:hypothetical protein